MLFRRECSKINRGLRCRCSIGEFWVIVVLFYHCPGGGRGGVWGDGGELAFGGLGGYVV